MKNQKNERRDDKTLRQPGSRGPTHRENSSLKSSIEEVDKTRERKTEEPEDESSGK